MRMSLSISAPQNEFHNQIMGTLGYEALRCSRALLALRKSDLGITLDIQNLCGGYVMLNLALGDTPPHICDNEVHQHIVSEACYVLD